MSYTFEEKKEYLNQFCKQFQSCSYGREGVNIWYIRCTLDSEKDKVLSAIRNSNRINLDEDCGDMIVIYFME